jgi:hypothetical protein
MPAAFDEFTDGLDGRTEQANLKAPKARRKPTQTIKDPQHRNNHKPYG